MELRMTAGGVTELHREDGWLYRLKGLYLGEVRVHAYGAEMDVSLRDISDETLNSLRVLRDALPGYHLIVNTF